MSAIQSSTKKSFLKRSSSTSRGIRTIIRDSSPVIFDGSVHASFSNQQIEKTTDLEAVIRLKDHEIERLEYMNNYLEMGVKKREEIIKTYFEENYRLKDEIKVLNKLVERLRKDLKSEKGSSQTPLPRGSILGRKKSGDDDTTEAPKQMLNQLFPNIGKKSLNPTHKWLKNQKTSTQQSSNSEAPPPLSLAFKIETVTLAQGLKDGQSLFIGNSGKQSILDMTDEDASKVLNDARLKNIEDLIDDEDTMLEMLNEMPKKQLVDTVDTFKSLFCDFKNLFKIIISMKKLVKASHTISVSLVLIDAMEKIVTETCEILNCDRATVFIVDEVNRELWSKVAKGSNATIRIPIDKGIVGYVATTGKAVRIDEAYLDPRFNKEVDRKTHYRTKTILCVPIKDFTGKIIGVCQGINKHDGLFSSDDEGIMHLLANQAGVMLKNSIQYDKTVVSHHRLLRLLKIGNDMYSAGELTCLLMRAENGLKELMFSDKALVYVFDRANNKILRAKDEETLESFDPCGIVGRVITTNEVIDVLDPNSHPDYNIMTDLGTSLPVVCIAIRSVKTKETVGAFQVLNIKGVGSISNGKGDALEIEIIRLFCEQAAICIELSTAKGFSKYLEPKNYNDTVIPNKLTGSNVKDEQ